MIEMMQRDDEVQIDLVKTCITRSNNITWKIATPEREKSPVEAAFEKIKTQKRMVSDTAKQNDSEKKGSPSKTFTSIYSWKSIKQTFCEPRLRLNSNFYGFKRT